MGYWIYDAMGGGGWREVDEWKAKRMRESLSANPSLYEGWRIMQSDTAPRECPSCGASMVQQPDGSILCVADAGAGICGIQFAPCRCVVCGCDGPVTQVDAEHPGWLCPACHQPR